MRTPAGKQITFTFASHPVKPLKLRWKAKVAFPEGADEKSVLSVYVTDGEDVPVDGGIFEFAGCKLLLNGGKAEMSYVDFIKGKSEVALWLHRQGAMPVPGGLTFE